MRIDKKLISQFLSNTCSTKECEEIAAYFEKNELHLDELSIFEDLKEEEVLTTALFNKGRAYRNLPFIKERIRFIYLKAAAVLLFGVIAYLLWHFSSSTKTSLNVAEPTYVISNEDASYKLVTLPDSSTLLLAPKAQISYKGNFLEDRVINQLGGKVKYSVRPNKLRPFRTRYENIETKVLGTVFTVHTCPDGRLSIDLSQGKVWIQDVDSRIKPIILDRSGAVVIDRRTLAYDYVIQKTAVFKSRWREESKIAKNMARQGISEWTNDHIELKGIDNADLIDLIERIYHVQIILKRASILNGNFTGSILQQEDLHILLESFCETNGCSYRKVSDTIYLE